MYRASLIQQQLSTNSRVLNQSPPLEGNFNAFRSNRRLQEAIKAFSLSPKDETEHLEQYGAAVGSAAWQEKARLINDNPPAFTPFDRQGHRVDQVTFHPHYHDIMDFAIRNRVHSMGWTTPKGEVQRGALMSMHYQLESGTQCPLTMTAAAVPVLEQNNDSGRFTEWIEKLKAPHYDPRDVAISEKKGVTLGMSMTEKQGGSDVRQNTTRAVPVAGKPNTFLLQGHKWFTSAPMCDGFLTLAYTEAGLSCFLVPRWLSAGERNHGLRFQRLKSKLGDRSNASSEVEYYDAVGWLVGKEAQGVRTIIDMVQHTRLDCLMASAGLVQGALFYAVNHCSHRQAFGGRLIEKPLMRNVLCDLALDAEAATALGMRVAQSFDDPSQRGFSRIAVAIGKYYVCKRAPSMVYECLECLGGNGFVEEFPLARMYRQAPLNAVWEGTGNVIVLDIFRAMMKDPDAIKALADEVASVDSERVQRAFGEAAAMMKDKQKAEIHGRVIAERLAIVLSACALLKSGGPKEIADAYIATRLSSSEGRQTQYGTLKAEYVLDSLLERHVPIL